MRNLHWNCALSCLSLDWDCSVINLKVPDDTFSTSRTSQLVCRMGNQNNFTIVFCWGLGQLWLACLFCAMAQSHMCHDSFTYVPWLIQMCAMTHLDLCRNSFRCVSWLIQVCAMTHSNMCRDAFRYVRWLIQMCAMTHLDVCHNSFICVPWLV